MSKPPSRTALIKKWNTKRESYQYDKRPSAQEVARTASYLEAEARKGNRPGDPSYDALVARYDELLRKHKAVMKAEKAEASPKPKRAGKPASSGKTAHVPAGNANGGQFTGRSNPPSGPRPGADTKKRRAAVVREQMSAGVSQAKARRYAASVVPASEKPKRAPKAEKPKAEPRPKAPAKPRKSREERDVEKYHADLAKSERYQEKWKKQYVKYKDKVMTREEAINQMYREGVPLDMQVAISSNLERARAPRKRKPSTTVPRQGVRERRNTQQRAAVYSEARRGLHNRRARGA